MVISKVLGLSPAIMALLFIATSIARWNRHRGGTNKTVGNSSLSFPTPEKVADAVRIRLPIALKVPTPESVAELHLIGFAKALNNPTPDRVAAPL